ncbi:BQ5605_C007g04568 [Microbotryum silenes-dioicae]|uniref:BQ5605_C007g04568 protein n=1 Tax=Microbotryum silenes-dioicae TaxID=796604 RepID=A0A2X0P302_9BASI|nr:BQ5605_C007g04568 [Microbotryum silenes-dioicae]
MKVVRALARIVAHRLLRSCTVLHATVLHSIALLKRSALINMPQVGPQLPPHLAAASSSSSSSGPQLPPHVPAGPSRPSTQTVGPVFPPSAPTAAGPSLAAPVQDDDDSDDDYGPSLPPDLAAARTTTASSIAAGPSTAPDAPTKKVLGPTLPSDYRPSPSVSGAVSDSAASPPLRPYKKETPLSNLCSDDDDDAFGPMPLPAGASGYSEENEGVRLVREREERQREREREAERKKNEKPKREEWMMVPPKDLDLMSSMDPTKLKSRGFQQMAGKGMAHGSAGKPNPEDVNLWTETPQERQKRLEDEMMGRKRKAEISNGDGGAGQPEETDEQRRKRMRDQQLRDEVDRYNKSSRNATLLDQHAKSSKIKEKDDKVPPRIWDHDRDMSVGGRLLDDSKRSDMIKNARDLGGRFGGGSYL